MFQSIRWRLVFSYAAITLLTVVVLGLVAFSLILESIQAQEINNLEANAQVVAEQAALLMQSRSQLDELEDLARTTGYLADLRVRILSRNNEILVDSGSPRSSGRFYWITPDGMQHLQMMMRELPDGDDLLILNVPGSEEGFILVPSNLPHTLSDAIEQDLNIQAFDRLGGMWGPRLTVEEDIPSEPPSTTDHRSPFEVEVPIGEPTQPLGFVQVMESRSIRAEAIEATLRPFLLAAAGAMLLAILVGVFIGHRLSTPIINLTQTAAEMGTGDLTVRANVKRRDEIGTLGKQFNLMADRLEASFEEISSERDTLQRFISDASHELRTPLTALRNFIEILGGTSRPNKQIREVFLSDSLAQVERMEWITRNLLDISRLQAGITSLSYETVSLEGLLRSAVTPLTSRAEEKNISISFDLPEEDLTLQMDRRLMELAFSNLIDNAVKFTPEDGEVSVGATSDGVNSRIWVKDSGIGINPEDFDHIFERFYRGRGHTESGSGLGLAFTKTVIDAHGGDIQVESDPDHGTTFTVTLPSSEGSDPIA